MFAESFCNDIVSVHWDDDCCLLLATVCYGVFCYIRTHGLADSTDGLVSVDSIIPYCSHSSLITGSNDKVMEHMREKANSDGNYKLLNNQIHTNTLTRKDRQKKISTVKTVCVYTNICKRSHIWCGCCVVLVELRENWETQAHSHTSVHYGYRPTLPPCHHQCKKAHTYLFFKRNKIYI